MRDRPVRAVVVDCAGPDVGAREMTATAAQRSENALRSKEKRTIGEPVRSSGVGGGRAAVVAVAGQVLRYYWPAPASLAFPAHISPSRCALGI